MINLEPNKKGLYDTRDVKNLTLHQMCCSQPMWTQRKIESQAKELEGLRERLKDGEFIWAEAMKHDGGCDCGNVTGEGITDACNKLLSQDTTQPDKGGE